MCTQKGVAPYKCFQLLGSFEDPNQEFKLEKVQFAAGTAFGNRELLTSASYDTDNQISCLALRADCCECEDCRVRTCVCLFLSDFSLCGA